MFNQCDKNRQNHLVFITINSSVQPLHESDITPPTPPGIQYQRKACSFQVILVTENLQLSLLNLSSLRNNEKACIFDSFTYKIYLN